MSSFFALSLIVPFALAKTVTYNWNVGWVTACPDGFCRPVIGVNGQWPLPVMEVDLGDTVVVNYQNNLGNETTSIHFHGQYQQGTNEMDGVAMVSQCSTPPGGSFTQTFTANPAGVHWYHSHDKGQYPDGLRAPMIVHDREFESKLGYDEEFTFSVSDWYHEQMPYLLHDYLTGSNFGGHTFGNQMPFAVSSLINDTQSMTINIQPNKKYLIRMVSMSALFNHVVSFEDHQMTIVGIDGIKTNATTADALTIAPGQRYEVLIQGKSNPAKSYAINSIMSGSSLSASGTLSYSSNGNNRTKNKMARAATPAPIDDMTIKPADGEALLSSVDHSITLPVSYTGRSSRRIILGNDTYLHPKVPTLYTALTTGSDAWNPAVYGPAANPYLLKEGEVVQIIVENHDNIDHPMHLHGYEFQVVARGSGTWDRNEDRLPAVPMRRDTVTTPSSGYLVLRFKAEKPGVWMFHCHMEFHVEAGMMVTMVESPDILQKTITIPQAALDICKSQNIPTSGNCAGSTVNVLDNSQCHNVADDSDNYGALIISRSSSTATASSSQQTSSPNKGRKARISRIRRREIVSR